jgi:hypothetical protein
MLTVLEVFFCPTKSQFFQVVIQHSPVYFPIFTSCYSAGGWVSDSWPFVLVCVHHKPAKT